MLDFQMKYKRLLSSQTYWKVKPKQTKKLWYFINLRGLTTWNDKMRKPDKTSNYRYNKFVNRFT